MSTITWIETRTYMSKTIDEMLTIIYKKWEYAELCNYGFGWIMRNTTDEGLMMELSVEYRGETPSEAIINAYQGLNKMIVKIVTKGEDYDARVTLQINGKEQLWVYNMGECPEDANVVRDLSFVYNITSMMRRAYEAGKNGEEFEIIEESEK